MTTRREAPPQRRRTERSSRDVRAKRPTRSGPETTPTHRQAPAGSTSQAKARAKARKAKAPKAVRVPLRERLIARLTSIDLRPQTLVAKVPFVVLVIGSLAAGLGLTLWLSTASAERSYELGTARETNRGLSQQKESLERQVLEAQAAPALAEAARNLGMIPSRDTAHLVQDAGGNWVVVGDPKPAEGASPPPLNTKLPDPTSTPAIPANRVEVPVMVPSPPKPAVPAVPAPVVEPLVPTGPLPGPAAPVLNVAGPAAPVLNVAGPAAPVPDAPQPLNAPNVQAGPEQSINVAPPAAPPT